MKISEQKRNAGGLKRERQKSLPNIIEVVGVALSSNLESSFGCHPYLQSLIILQVSNEYYT
jgi:hypothetical protein